MYTITLMPSRLPLAALFAGLAVSPLGAQQRDSVFAATWEAVCARPAPVDSGIVYGQIRDARTGKPVAKAHVDVIWYQLSVGDGNAVHQRQWKLQTEADERGAFGICGIPTDEWLRIGGGSAGRLSGLIDLVPGESRVVRRDLSIGAEGDSASMGTVFGTITQTDGTPFSNARVVLDESAETKTDAEGHFAFRKVASGTRQLEILSIGMVPVIRTIDIVPGDTTPVAFSIRRITALDVVRVSTSRRARAIIADFEARKKTGMGYTREAGDLAAHSDLSTVFREFPSTFVDGSPGNYTIKVTDPRGALCAPEVWIDGSHSAQSAINTVRTSDIVALELYIRSESVPVSFRGIGETAQCGAIIIWTTWSFAR